MINKITLTGTIAEVKPDYTFRGTEYSNIILGYKDLAKSMICYLLLLKKLKELILNLEI